MNALEYTADNNANYNNISTINNKMIMIIDIIIINPCYEMILLFIMYVLD